MLDYTLFGESHGPVVGVLLRHVPAGVPIDELQMERDLLRRRPSGALATARQEPDEVQFLSGVFQGRTTGMPLVMAPLMPLLWLLVVHTVLPLVRRGSLA